MSHNKEGGGMGEAERVRSLVLSSPILKHRFEIVKTLGTGAAGVVFHVRDRSEGNKDLALKVLANDSAFDDNTLKRFFRELQILRDIRHPNLIEAYDFIAMDELSAFTMEYIRGSDLGKLTRSTKLTTEQIDHIFQSVLSALHQLHQNGIAHRDLKLENVLISEKGVVKLTDLGIVKQLSSRGSTQTGLLLGTTPYLPPEYVKYNQYHLRGDIYAVGLMLYECLTGQRWMQRKHTTEAIQTIADSQFEFPKLALAGLPWKYRAILQQALAVDPIERYPSAEAMRQAFDTDTGDPAKDESAAVALEQRVNISAFAARSREQSDQSLLLSRRLLVFVLMAIAGFLLSFVFAARGGFSKLQKLGLIEMPALAPPAATAAPEPPKATAAPTTKPAQRPAKKATPMKGSGK